MRNIQNMTDKPLAVPDLEEGDELQPGEMKPLKDSGVSNKVIISMAMAGFVKITPVEPRE